jgi:hypothetical protein
MLAVAILIVAATLLLAWAWVRGIDNMKDNHPEYKGEDFLNVKGDTPLQDDEWDNSHHNEDI